MASLNYRDRVTGRPSGRDETEAERVDRNLGELLQELRVALPGVQVLFAFLLAVPFQERAYFLTLLFTAISAALLIAPSAHHRLAFRMQRKEELVQVANRFAIVGLGFLALAMTCAIILVTDVLFGALMTAVTGALAATMFVVLWFLLPARWSRRVSE
jgi:putative flippase GtrA